MGIGIQICGLNGCGKSTLGKALSEKLGFHFIDNETLYFTRNHTNEPYANPRSCKEVYRLLMSEVTQYPDFVFAAVKGDYGKEIISMYDYVVVMEVPREIRMCRVKNRSFQKFGSRMLVGGDLHEQEEEFFRMVESRKDDYAKSWLHMLKCPVIRVDGTKPVDENIERIINQMNI